MRSGLGKFDSPGLAGIQFPESSSPTGELCLAEFPRPPRFGTGDPKGFSKSGEPVFLPIIQALDCLHFQLCLSSPCFEVLTPH